MKKFTPVRAKKHLGQHFLQDENIAQKIVDSLDPACSQVLEIGPGTGVLTKYLLQKDLAKFVAMDVDRDSVAFLKETYPAYQQAFLEADFLRNDPRKLFAENFCIIGNFPYNISSQIFFRVIEYRESVTKVVGMVQKEVAERIAEPPGTKTYGILSVLLQAWFDIEYLFTVHEHVFHPPPKVKSAVIKLTRNPGKQLHCDEKLFTLLVKTAFNQRRKTLRNALKPFKFMPSPQLDEMLDLRAERLSVEDFAFLANQVKTS